MLALYPETGAIVGTEGSFANFLLFGLAASR